MNHDPQANPPADRDRLPGSEARDETRDQTLVLAEEILNVGTREVVTGTVRVRTVTNEREEQVRLDLARSDIEVTRVPIDREIDRIPETRQDGEVTIIPVVEEVLVVTKRLVLKEEVHVRRTHSTELFEAPVVLHTQEAVIDRLDADANSIQEETIK